MTAPSSQPAERNGFAARLVSRPVTVLMLFLTLLGAGVISYLRIPLTLLPTGLTSSSLNINLPYRGAGPMEVEDQLTRPVEEALRTIPGITEIISYSSEGRSSINVEFSTRTSMDVAYGEVRDRIERVRASLPPEMDRYRIYRWNSNTDLPVMWIGIQYDGNARDPFGPIEKIIVPRLEGVNGVARVNLMGLVDEAIRIFVDVEKVRGYGINLGEVIRGLQADNFTLPAGQVDEGTRTFSLRVDSRFKDEQDIRNYPVGNGRVLGDVAEIVRGRAYRDWVWRINSRPAVGMSISRESDENTIEVCERIEAVVAQLEADPRLDGITINVFWSQKDSILQAINGLKSAALWGGLFAIIVLFAFLRDLRLTLIAALAIPSSLLAALMAVYFSGQTLNLISLAGFTLGIGMLVDNAVVVIENIARKRAQGQGRHESAANGSSEVGLAVLAATLTSVVVFLPLVFMNGDQNTRVMMREVGLPISYSLLASLLVAMIFIPTFTSRLMRRHKTRQGEIDVAHVRQVDDGRLVRRYRGTLAWVLDHRFPSFMLVIGIVMLTRIASDNIPVSAAGGDRQDSVSVNVKVPSTYLLADANKVFERLEAFSEENQEEFGYDFYSANFERRGGRIQYWPREDLPREQADQLGSRLREAIPELPGVETTVGWDNSGGGKELRLNFEGPDFMELAAIAEDLKHRLAALSVTVDGETKPLLENVRTDIERGIDEVHVRVNRERTNELGVTPETIRGVVAWGLGGQRLPDLQEGDREIRVMIEYGQSDEESLEFLRNLGLPRDVGGTVPLQAVADLKFSKAVGTLVRRNGRTSTGISATPAVDNLYLVSARIADVLRNYPFPDNVDWKEQGGRREVDEDLAELGNTLLFSLFLVLLLMAILLESLLLPFAIILSVPLAIMGVDISLYVFGFPKDVMVYVGLILLAGVVVNNAIVLLDRVQRLRRGGVPRREALIEGGGQRLRPILMTALTTIFGLMPMAAPQWFPGEAGSSGYESMAVTVAGGLAFSTMLTLLVVPLFYTYFDDLGIVFSRLRPWRTRAELEAEQARVAEGPA
jgi:HAE1 family hydrophobic/amphiphilic exporter-1